MEVTSAFDTALDRLDRRLEVEAQSTTTFEFEPVPLDVFVRDRKYLGLPPLGARQLEAVEFATQIYLPHTMKELGWKPKRYVKELVLLWGKGCLAGHTRLIDISTGGVSTIKDLEDRRESLFVTSYNGGLVSRSGSVPWKTKTDDIYRVTLSDGSELDCNLSHRVLKKMWGSSYRSNNGEWCSVGDLSVGDSIFVGVNEYDTDKSEDLDLMWAIGALIGDGIIGGSGKDSGVGFIASDENVEIRMRLAVE